MFQSPANEFLSHMHEKNRKKRKFDYFLIAKNSPSPVNKFLLHTVEAIPKFKKKIEKNRF